jgi:hypothetical protein
MRRAVRMTRHAISPRLAMRIFLNIGTPSTVTPALSRGLPCVAVADEEQGGCRIKSGMTRWRKPPAIGDQDFLEHSSDLNRRA